MNNFKRNIYRTEDSSEIVPPQNCKRINAAISNDELVIADDGTLRAYYTNCSGIASIFEFVDAGTYNNAFCADNNTQLSLQYVEGGIQKVATISFITLTTTDC